MSQPSLAGYIIKRPWLKKMMMPVANWYANAAGYRKLGLKYVHLQRTGERDRMDSGHYCDMDEGFQKLC
jgi:hypothetical protein